MLATNFLRRIVGLFYAQEISFRFHPIIFLLKEQIATYLKYYYIKNKGVNINFCSQEIIHHQGWKIATQLWTQKLDLMAGFQPTIWNKCT